MPSTRRALLASAAAVAVAGCSTRDADPGTATDTPTPAPATDDRTATPERPDSVDAEWPVPGADPGGARYARGSTGPTDVPRELWSVPTDAALTRPVVADGTLYVGGDDGVVRAFDARSGETRWTEGVGAPVETVQAAGGRLYAGTSDAVVALTDDGDELWRTGTPDRRVLLATPEGVYRLSDGDLPAVAALDPESGDSRWETTLGEPWSATLFLADDRLFVSTDTANRWPWILDPESGDVVGGERPESEGNHHPGARYALDGTVYATDPFYGDVWAYDAAPYSRDWSGGLDGGGGRRTAAGAGHLYALDSSADGRLTALSLSDGETAWTDADVDGIRARPAVAEEAVVVLTDERLRCFDPADGTERWSRTAAGVGRRFVLADDVLFTVLGGTVRALRPA